MSEHQYYEFQAIDHKLSPDTMAELRQISSRATITPRRMINTYNYGDFGGDPKKLVARHFDAFLYWANWGTREMMLKFPRNSIDVESFQPYLAGTGISLTLHRKYVVVRSLQRAESSDGSWEVELPPAARIRNEILSGDLRSIYLGWLLSASQFDLDEDILEPPVPPGLGELSRAQEQLVGFLDLPCALWEVAAEASPPLAPLDAGALESWIAGLPEPEKNLLLMNAASGKGRIGPSLLMRFKRESNQGRTWPQSRRRNVGSLLKAADDLQEAREEEARQAKALEEERLAREKAEARALHLDTMARRSKRAIWKEIDSLIDTKLQKEYDKAVALLVDLRDLALRDDTSSEFRSRVDALKEQHARKPTLIGRIRKAGLIES